MITTTHLFILIVIVGAGAAAIALLKAKLAAQQASGAKFKQKTLLTPNEFEFLSRLEAAAPELRFFPQVAMGALLDPAVPRSDRKTYFRLRGMFSQKIVDFVAQRRSDGGIVSIIELDDRTHDAGKDAKRDEMLQSAGYRIVRWHSKSKPDSAAIRAELFSPSPAGAVQSAAANRPGTSGAARSASSAAKP